MDSPSPRGAVGAASSPTVTSAGEAGRELADEVGRVSTGLVDTARVLSGIGGETDRRSLRRAARAQGVSLYPLGAIFALALAQSLNSVGLAGGGSGAVLQPEVAATLGVGPSFFVLMGALGQVVSVLAPLATSHLVQQQRLRAVILVAAGLVWSAATILAGFTPTVMLLAVFVLVDTATSGATGTVEVPLLLDCYPPRMRVRVIAALRAVGYAGAVVTPALVALLTGPLGLTWRGVYVATGAVALLLVVAAVRLRDPGYGRWDAQVVREVARTRAGAADTSTGPAVVRLRLAAVFRRLWTIRTLRLSMLGAMVSAVTAPVVVYVAFLYEQRFGFDTTERASIAAAAGGVGIASLLVFSRLGDRLFQRDPRIVFWGAAGLSVVGSAATVTIAVTTNPAIAVAASLVTAAFAGLIGPAATLGGIAIIPAHLRNYSAAVYGLFSVAGYGLGALLLTGIGQQYGIGAALLAVTVPQAIGALLSGLAGRHYVADLDRTNTELIEDEVVAAQHRAGRPLPLLACRGIDFYYGARQVLFGVDLTVDEGELVALLGVNGAGKSTLLRVISGLGFPERGTVRIGGQSVTYLDPPQRARLGVLQIPGGRAVFDELTVAENLRLFGYHLGRDRRKLEAVIEDCFGQFPPLAERRSSRARLLSGGERQMLGLCRAWLTKPRLLLIDELSLGLAPKVVDTLIESLRRINAEGTAVVIVEQSIDVALRLAHHAYFMERGTIHFDGPAADLATRTDLLRPVFLATAQAGTGAGNGSPS